MNVTIIKGGGENVNALDKDSAVKMEQNLNAAFNKHNIHIKLVATQIIDNAELSKDYNAHKDPLNLVLKDKTLMQVIVVEKVYDQYPGYDKVYPKGGMSFLPFPVEGLKGLDVTYMTAGALSGPTKSVLIHEIGHWLGLFHTFQVNNGCPAATSSSVTQTSHGDYVLDTSLGSFFKMNPLTTRCEGFKVPETALCTLQGNSKPEPYPLSNYMSYSPCHSEFTEGQVRRMKAMWAWRSQGQGPRGDTIY
jgi:hypothetical protein